MSLPLGTCGITELTGTQMVDGATQMDEFGAEISIVDGDIAFADLNGDGATDAVVALTCFGGGNAIWSDAVVWLAGTAPEKLAFSLYGVLDVLGIDSIPADLPVSDAIWDDAVEWLDGSTATFSGMPCSRAQDDGTTALCLFFAPDALEVSDILLELDKTEDDEVWTITEFSPILD